MAIPTTLFNNSWGVALMRYNHSISEWFFVGWAHKQVFLEQLPAGNYAYALWLVVGGNRDALTVTVNGTARIVAQQAFR